MTRRRWLALLIVVSLGACGSEKAAISDDARTELQPRVAEIRALADARHADQLQAMLAEMRLVVDNLLQRGQLTRQGADDVLAAAARIESHLELITTTTQAPPPSEDEDDDEDREDEEDKEDKEDKDD